jgi:hypothetical protein
MAVVMAGGVLMRVVVRVPVMMMIVIMILVRVLETGKDGYIRCRLRVALSAEEKHHGCAEQGKQRDEPNLVEKVHAVTI